MFDKIRLMNFRSIKDSGVLDLRPVNILIGRNNSGKSSVLYALLLLRETMTDRDDRTALTTSLPGLEVGGYRDLVYGRDPATLLKLRFKLAEGINTTLVLRAGKPERWSDFRATFGYDGKQNRIQVEDSEVRIPEGKLVIGVRRTAGRLEVRGVPDHLRKHVRIKLAHFVPTVLTKGKPPHDQKVARAALDYMYRSVGCSVLLSEALQNIQYVGPLRQRLAPFAVTGTRTYSEVGATGADVMRVLASQQRVARLGKGGRKTAERGLREWLCDRFGILRDIRLSAIRPDLELTALLADEPRGFRDMNVAYMGFGVSQLVPLTVATVMLPPSGCLLVEQPEVHLHPAAQAQLADLFVSNVEAGRQCIVETHSEHLVLRLRRRIAEGKVDPANIRLFYVEKSGRQTRIQPLDIDDKGMVPDWPRGFFDDGYGEAMRIAEARLHSRGG